MRLPRTFFFRLDAHQATIVIAVFQFILYFLVFVVLSLLKTDKFGLTDGCSSVNGSLIPCHEIKDKIGGFELGAIVVTIIQVGALLDMFFMACAVCAVLLRKRWLVLPYIVMEGFDVVKRIYGFIAFLKADTKERKEPTTQAMVIFLLVVLFLSLIGMSLYCLLVGITCFRKMGAANQDTPNRNSAIDVPLQQFVTNKSRALV